MPARSRQASRVSRPPRFFSVLAAGALCLAMAYMPGFDLALYPLRLLSTMIHEGGHAVATLLSGGTVLAITLSPDSSGLTLSRGGWRPFILSAGYLGSILVGCCLLLASRNSRTATALLLILGGVTVALTLFYARNLLTWGIGLFWGLLLIGWALRGPKESHGVGLAFLGIQNSLNAMADLRTLFDLSFVDKTPTDAALLSREVLWGLLPPAFWAILWAVTALLFTMLTLRRLLRA